jgi:uncharacterized membrane protein YjjP (DUF1212 family)
LNPVSESYSFELDGVWNFSKLYLLDELCHDIYEHQLPFEVAVSRLESIEELQL